MGARVLSMGEAGFLLPTHTDAGTPGRYRTELTVWGVSQGDTDPAASSEGPRHEGTQSPHVQNLMPRSWFLNSFLHEIIQGPLERWLVRNKMNRNIWFQKVLDKQKGCVQEPEGLPLSNSGTI